MSKSRSKRVLITMGDPAGVGPEVIASALSRHSLRGNEFVVIGNEHVFRSFWKKKALPSFIHKEFSPGVKHVPGRPTEASGRDSLFYLDHAITMLRNGAADALVTGPVSKESVGRFIKGFKGHTTYLANAFKAKNVEMVFIAGDARMVLVTRHIPLKDVPSAITTDKVFTVTKTTYDFLKDRFKIKSPRVAVCGLNPHAGEGGHIGEEEILSINKAVKKAQARGMDVRGPFPADTVFEPHNCKGYDLIVSMYHDQGLPVFKAMYFDKLINLSVGLPFIRTSPAHGTAFGIAGKGVADAGSMRAAIELARMLA